MKKILLLGSGELGKEFVIAAMRAGQYVIACDRYDNAPAIRWPMNVKYSLCSMVTHSRLW
jgi:formate-dependent phosphoribosylglycinamide formyltransferase (GAR transformylase)